MRWFDWYLVLLAATALFGMSVTWAAGMSPSVQAALFVVVVALLALAGWRAVHTTKIAVVGRRGGHLLARLEDALDDTGFAARLCPGPPHRVCPVLKGRPCPVGGHPAAAVVFIAAGQGHPVPPCRQGLGVPVLLVAEDPTSVPSCDEKEACVAWSQGPAAVARAVSAIVAEDTRQVARTGAQ